MADFIDRPYSKQTDQDSVERLVLAFRVATRVDLYPTLWRFRTLLTYGVWNPEQDIRIWEKIDGAIVAFAMLWRRQPSDDYLMLEQFVHPQHKSDALFNDILNWTIQRTQYLASQEKQTITISVNALDPALETYLEGFNFAPRPPDFEQENLYFFRSLQEAIASPVLPEDYSIRPIRESRELKEYQALADFEDVNEAFEEMLLDSDEYRRLVLVEPGGKFLSYCEFCIVRQEWAESGQRIAWIDYLGTAPEYRRQGFGKAILLASLKEMQAWGVDRVMLQTVNGNTPAVQLYQSTGFTISDNKEPLWYRKDINEAI